jgi:hypothetical protein
MTTAVLPPENFKTIQSVLRWAAIGVQPAMSTASMAIDALNSVKDDALAPVLALLEEVRRGVLPSQAACIEAEDELLNLKQSQVDVDKTTPFGDLLLRSEREGQR